MRIGVISDVTWLMVPILDQQWEVIQGRWGLVNYQKTLHGKKIQHQVFRKHIMKNVNM